MKGQIILVSFLFLVLVLFISSANSVNEGDIKSMQIPIESEEEYSPCCESQVPERSVEVQQRDRVPEHVVPVDSATFKRWKEEAKHRSDAPRGTMTFHAEEYPLHPSAPGVSRKFQGLDQSQGGTFPPDTNIAVGETHIIEAVNVAYRLSTKTNTNIVIESLKSLHNESSGFLFDPRVHYDRFSKRFIAIAVQTPSSFIHVAVSRNSAPADLDQSWCTYRIRAKTRGGKAADYPIVGLNEKWLVVTTNQFTSLSGDARFKKSLIKIIDLASLSNNSIQCPKLKVFSASNTDFSIVPAQHQTQGGAPNHPLYLIASEFATLTDRYFLYTVSGTSRPSVTRTIVTNSQPYGLPPVALQKGGPPLSTGDTRIQDAEFRNGTLHFAHNTICNFGSLPNETCARVAELNINNGVLESQITIGGGHNNFFWFPSIGVNSQKDTALLFQQSGKSRRFGLAHTSKRDGANSFSAYKILAKGKCSRELLDLGDRNRTGDYTGVHVDPADDKGVWYAAEYAKQLGSECGWGTYIVNVKNP